ncbi:hypothetical protein F442_22119, partial [Phytophthora nicotianae P10297]
RQCPAGEQILLLCVAWGCSSERILELSARCTWWTHWRHSGMEPTSGKGSAGARHRFVCENPSENAALIFRLLLHLPSTILRLVSPSSCPDRTLEPHDGNPQYVTGTAGSMCGSGWLRCLRTSCLSKCSTKCKANPTTPRFHLYNSKRV